MVVSLKKKPSKNSYSPEVTYQFPKVNAAVALFRKDKATPIYIISIVVFYL